MKIEDQDVSGLILAWYDDHRRVMPWRGLPGMAVDPYHVWLSEIMLQQTVVNAVVPYFEKFVAQWPRIDMLARADLDDVLKVWAGLGYYARARNLHACAQMVVTQYTGKFPATENELRALPGVGPYTAAAIAAIAFNVPVVPLDGNIERVTARYFAITDPLPGVKAQLQEKAQMFGSESRPGDLAQALMDLGSGVCTPRSPDCAHCPLQKSCSGYRQGIADKLPLKAPKKARPTRFGLVFWAEREDGHILLRRRPEKGLLGGMMEIPSSPWMEDNRNPDISAYAPFDTHWERIDGLVKHVFTHFSLELEVRRARIPVRGTPGDHEMNGDTRWVHSSDLGEEALPSVMRKIVRHAQQFEKR